jgi:hypothetical protein
MIGILVVVLLLVGYALVPRWVPDRLVRGLYRERNPMAASYTSPQAFFAQKLAQQFIFHTDDPVSSVSVREGASDDGRLNRSIINNGKSDGNLIGDYATMSLASLIPALLAEGNARTFVIGFGTGVTAGALAALESVKSVTVAEISQGVIDAAEYFEGGNLGAASNPKVNLVRGDAYRTLMRSDGHYDVIVSEPSNPWVAGVEMLYSLEFLEAARDRLAPGGVYAQWLQLYETDVETIELVLRTYTSVFDHVSVWYAQGMDLLLLGLNEDDRALDVRALERRFRRSDFRAGFARSGIDEFLALLAHELLPLGTLHQPVLSGPLHTLRHPILSHKAARAFFVGGRADVPRFTDLATTRVGFWNSLLRRYADRPREPLGEDVLAAVALETCNHKRKYECATLLARWQRDHPESEALAVLLADLRGRFPNPDFISEKSLKILSVLFGRSEFPKLAGRGSLLRAIGISEKFVSHYHYAVPFDRKVLAAAWRMCRFEDCDQARVEVEENVGPLL